MFRIISRKRLVMSLCFGILICCSSVSLAQDNAKPFVRLATYWDAPGVVNAISRDDRWIVIYDLNSNMSRLVEVATGRVQVTNAGDNTIHFSPSGRFATVNAGEEQTTQILELGLNKLVAKVLGVIVQFSADESLIMVDQYDTKTRQYTTSILDTMTGGISLQVKGDGAGFSPDSRLIAVDDTSKLTTSLIAVATGKTIFEFLMQEYKDGEVPNTNVRFSPDGKLVVIYQSNNGVSYMFDSVTWKMLYNIYGFVTFSADSRFIKVRQGDGAVALALLLEANTGNQLDKVYGDMWFSDDGKLLYRMDSTNCAYRGYMQVIDLSSLKQLLPIKKGCVFVNMLENNTIMHISSGDITKPQTQRFIEAATGSVVWQTEANEAEMIDFDQHLGTVTRNARQSIVNFVTGKVFAADQEITMSNNKRFAFASNGLVVDLYGAPDLRMDTMPVPRSGSGIVQARKGKFSVYPIPSAVNPIVEESLNPFNFYVMGKSADEKWLYVTYTVYGNEIKRKQGWIEYHNLSVIEDWHDVPVVGGDNPLKDLEVISS